MDELERIIGGHQEPDTSILEAPSTSSGPAQWCSSCRSLADVFEEKFLSNFIAVKQKIFFTDNLIKMHQDTKRQLEEMTKKYNQAVKNKNLIQSQLQLVLSKDQPSFTDGEKLQTRNNELERMVEDLNTQVLALDESRKLHENTIKVLRAEDTVKISDLKKKYSAQISELKKDLSEKNEENKKLNKRNKDLVKRNEALRKRKNVGYRPSAGNLDDAGDQNPVKVQILSTKSNAGLEKEVKEVESTKKVTKTEKTVPHLELIESDGREADKTSGDEDESGNHDGATNEGDETHFATIASAEAPPSPKRLSNADKLELANENRIVEFQIQPSSEQLEDLASMAQQFKSYFSQRPEPRKRPSIDFLSKLVAEFCSKHSIEPRDDLVATKLLKLHRSLFKKNKKVLARVEDVIAITKEAQDTTVVVQANDLSVSSDVLRSGNDKVDNMMGINAQDMSVSTVQHDVGQNKFLLISSSSDESTTANLNPKNLVMPSSNSSSDSTAVNIKSQVTSGSNSAGDGKTDNLIPKTLNLSVSSSSSDSAAVNQKRLDTSSSNSSGNSKTDNLIPKTLNLSVSSCSSDRAAVILNSKSLDTSSSSSSADGTTMSLDTKSIVASSLSTAGDSSIVNFDPPGSDADPQESENENASFEANTMIHDVTMDSNTASKRMEPVSRSQRKESFTSIMPDLSGASDIVPVRSVHENETRDPVSTSKNSSSEENSFTSVMPEICDNGMSMRDESINPPTAGTTQPQEFISVMPIINDEIRGPDTEDNPKNIGTPPKTKKLTNTADKAKTSEGAVDSGEFSKNNSGSIPNNKSTLKRKLDESMVAKEEKTLKPASVSSENKPKRIRTRSMTASSPSETDDNFVLPQRKKRTSRIRDAHESSKSQHSVSMAASPKIQMDASLEKAIVKSDLQSGAVDEVKSPDGMANEGKSSDDTVTKASDAVDKTNLKKDSYVVSDLCMSDSDEASSVADNLSPVRIQSESFSYHSQRKFHTKVDLKKKNASSNNVSGTSLLTLHKVDLGHRKALVSESESTTAKSFPISLRKKQPEKGNSRPSTLRTKSLMSERTAKSHAQLAKKQRRQHKTKSVSSAEMDSNVDLNDVFSEMLLTAELLSPLPSVVPVAIQSISDTAIESNVDCPADSEQTANGTHLEPDDSKGKTLISPSTDLCTAISFNTPKKKKNNQDIISTPPEPVGDTDQVMVPSPKAHMPKQIPPKTNSQNSKELFRPRRFSCEAPERAVNVPPIKPSSSRAMPDIVLPSLTKSDGESGKTFPQYRKDTDIPSHWHASLQIFSDCNKTNDTLDEVESSQKQSAGSDNDPDVQDDSDVLSTSKCENNGISPTNKESGIMDQDHSGKSEPTSAKKGITDEIEITMNSARFEGAARKTSDSTDKSAPTSEDHDNSIDGLEKAQHDNTTTDVENDDTELVMDISDACAVSDSVDSADDTPVLPAASSDEQDCPTERDVSDDSNSQSPLILKTFKDLGKLMMMKKNGLKKPAVIDDSFIMNEITTILRRSPAENVDVLLHLSASVQDVAISHLSLCEQKFLKRIRVIQISGVFHKYALVNEVIPFFMKVLKEIYWHQTKFKSEKCRWSIPELEQLTPFAYTAKGSLSTAGMSALLRVFFFLCKAAKVFSPIVEMCRYHILAKRSDCLITAILEGLLCWPKVLLHLEFGRIVLNAIARDCSSSLVVSAKSKKIYLLQRVNFLYDKAGWKRSPNTTTLHEDALSNAMSTFESLTFSQELATILNEEDGGASHSLTALTKSSYVPVYTIEMFPKCLITNQITAQVLHGRFWPLLKNWSQHVHFNLHSESNSVSDATMVGIMESFAHMLSYYLLRQRQYQKDQPILPQMQEHFQTICHLLDNLSTRYSERSPKIVRCSVAAFLLRTCFCDPSLAHESLLKWAEAFANQRDSLQSIRNESDISLTIALAGCGRSVIRKICEWLDRSCSFSQNDSLVKVLWPE